MDKSLVLEIIDKTSTPMGSRLLRRWLCFPSVDLSEIKFRHDIVEEFSKLSTTNLIEKYNSIIDIERIISKITNYKVNPRELINFKFSLSVTVPEKSMPGIWGNSLTNLPPFFKIIPSLKFKSE